MKREHYEGIILAPDVCCKIGGFTAKDGAGAPDDIFGCILDLFLARTPLRDAVRGLLCCYVYSSNLFLYYAIFSAKLASAAPPAQHHQAYNPVRYDVPVPDKVRRMVFPERLTELIPEVQRNNGSTKDENKKVHALQTTTRALCTAFLVAACLPALRVTLLATAGTCGARGSFACGLDAKRPPTGGGDGSHYARGAQAVADVV